MTSPRPVNAPTIEIVFPFPPRVLSPNAGAHHMTKHKARKAYMAECEAPINTAVRLYRRQGVSFPLKPVVACALTFSIPRLSQDADNLVAQFKAGIDALKRQGVIEDDNAKHFKLLAPVVERGGASVHVALFEGPRSDESSAS